MRGGSVATLSVQGTLTYTTVKQAWSMPPIDVDFQVFEFTASGSNVRYLRVTDKSNYQSVKWVRYSTGAIGSYQVRVSRFVLPLGCWLIIPRSSKSDTRGCLSFAISLDIYQTEL